MSVYVSICYGIISNVSYGVISYISLCVIGEKPKSVILDCTHVSAVDYTTIQGIIELIADFLRNDVRFAVASAPVSILKF